MKKIIRHDFGLFCGRIIIAHCKYDIKILGPLLEELNYTGDKLQYDQEHSECIGLCYDLANGNNLVWINSTLPAIEQVDAITHEISHAMDNWMKVFSYTCGEIRARIHGGLVADTIKKLKLLRE